ncbi:MAG TPA: efflux RND transporter periplasmic adaptor subunit [Acidobacteriaceae bacterium]|nr:efflux RND transporter periplasmic adaptor subunit [Acidobacteriaceae bacterium]
MTLRFSSLILAAPVLAIPALLLGCSQSNPAKPASPPVAQAQLVKVTEQQVPHSIPLTGTVHANETATISAQVPGNIRRVWVQAGDHVRAGQLLITLDDSAERAGLNRAMAAQAAVEKQQQAAHTGATLAASTLARYQMLKQEKSVSPQEFDQVQKQSQIAALQAQALQAQSDEAKAAIAGARTQFGYTQIRAPFAGVVTARMADPGTLAGPGVPLLQLDSAGSLQLYTSVDESLIGSIRTGMKIPVSIDGAAASGITGTVAQIVPAADPASRTFLLKLDLPRIKDLRAGMYGSAQLPGTLHAAILAPQSAVVMRGSLACVYALDANGVAQLRYITLGNRQGNDVEVLSGLSAGETIVNNPGDHDLAGKKIEEQQ